MAGDLDLCLAFFESHPRDAAQALERLPAADVAALVESVPARAAAAVFDELTPVVAADSLSRMAAEKAAAVAAELRADVAASLLRRMDDPARAALFEQLPGAEADYLRALLRYPVGTAGALMDPRVPAVPDDVTAGEALTRVRRSPRHLLYYVYVVDRERRLAGMVDLRDLMLARTAEPVAAIMRTPVPRVLAGQTRAAILGHPGWRDVHALPVVDDAGAFVGAIRYETFRRLEDDARQQQRGTDAVAAVFALGELYWLGLSGVLEGFAAAVKRAPGADAHAEEDLHGTA